MTDPTGEVTFAQSYDPYGVITSTAGTSQTAYGFTGEQYSAETQMVYLRARYYSPAEGRFSSRDTWGGDVNRPLSLNRWGYVNGDPVNHTDPTGRYPQPDSEYEACTSSPKLARVILSTKESVCAMISELEDENYLTDLPDA